MTKKSFIDLNYELRDLMRDDKFHLTSITSRQVLEDTYSHHLYKTGLAKKWRYRLILALMYKSIKPLMPPKYD